SSPIALDTASYVYSVSPEVILEFLSLYHSSNETPAMQTNTYFKINFFLPFNARLIYSASKSDDSHCFVLTSLKALSAFLGLASAFSIASFT
ncbi:MAG: hypothetical protein ACI849_001054, partial [Patiriisocius sp.]